jgi:hypothetical protein
MGLLALQTARFWAGGAAMAELATAATQKTDLKSIMVVKADNTKRVMSMAERKETRRDIKMLKRLSGCMANSDERGNRLYT